MGQVYTRPPKAEGKNKIFKFPVCLYRLGDTLIEIIRRTETWKDRGGDYLRSKRAGDVTLSCIKYSALGRTEA